MKVEVTRKRIYENYNKDQIVKIGYCDLQNLLSFEDARFYTCGINGWNCDIYEFKDRKHRSVLLSTGYSPLGKEYANFELVKEYEKKAYAIPYSDKKREILHELCLDFIDEALKGVENDNK